MAKKTRVLLPSLREKKRYLAYEVISRHKFNDALEINNAIYETAKDFLGNLGMARAGIVIINDKFDMEKQRGILKVSNRHIDELRASLIFIKDINGKEAIVRSIGASGILKKAQQKYLN